jgi:hypothetical protein
MQKKRLTIHPFDYIEELDAFVLTEEFKTASDLLGLAEWHAAVWIGRLFTLDNDLGEHWFDNWEEREAMETRAQELGIDATDLMIVVPDRFADGRDGPCHPPELRKAFWTDVLKSLELSYQLLFDEARLANAQTKELFPEEFIDDLEERISQLSGNIG